MCAIAGIVLADAAPTLDLHTPLAAMAASMHHRGPDDNGVYVDVTGRAGLANCRLGIRDLSPAGHMPMANPDGTLCITYNGEIYNADDLRAELACRGYTFRSQGDTEVVLHGYAAWGEAVVSRLRGMFAFAILDRRPSSPPKLFLARDRLGVKPLYYARTAHGFHFASELRGLLAHGLISRELDPAGLAGFLMLGAVPAPWTIRRAIRALEPATTLSLPLDRPTAEPVISTYWSLPSAGADPRHAPEVLAELRHLLAEATRISLVSDVPVGLFLSGGIDSSAILALMRQATNETIRTCSIRFREAEYDESTHARAIAAAAGAEHHERLVSAQDFADELDAIVQAMDQPSVDGVNTYFVAQTARQAGLSVALSGLGGDELFGGYTSTFTGIPQLLRYLWLLRTTPRGAAIGRAALRRLTDQRWRKLRDALDRPITPASAYLVRRGLFAPSEVGSLLSPDLRAEAATFDPCELIAGQAAHDGQGTDLFAWISWAELRTYTHHQLLRDTDAMSMAHSLEVRVPFLDHHLVEYALRLPARSKLAGTGSKPLLTRALANDLPEALRVPRRKRGFTFPFDEWLRGPLQPQMRERLAEVAGSGLLCGKQVEAVWTGYRAGRIHWSRPWALAMLCSVLGTG